jgi:hypothetical protein
MDFKPTQEMLDATGKVKKCKEIVNAIRPIAMKYKTEILNEMHAEPDDGISKYVDLPGVILDPKNAWALRKDKFGNPPRPEIFCIIFGRVKR